MHVDRSIGDIALDHAASGNNAAVADIGTPKNDGSSPDPAIGANFDITTSEFPVNWNPPPEDMIMIVNKHVGTKLTVIANSN